MATPICAICYNRQPDPSRIPMLTFEQGSAHYTCFHNALDRIPDVNKRTVDQVFNAAREHYTRSHTDIVLWGALSLTTTYLLIYPEETPWGVGRVEVIVGLAALLMAYIWIKNQRN